MPSTEAYPADVHARSVPCAVHPADTVHSQRTRQILKLETARKYFESEPCCVRSRVLPRRMELAILNHIRAGKS